MFSEVPSSNLHKWNLWVSKKVNICVWRAVLDRLPTPVNLLSRGVQLASTSCPICGNVEENVEHCIILCPRVLGVWRKIWGWWNLNLPTIFPSFSIGDLASGSIASQGCPRTKKILHGVFCCSSWCIWKWRNKVVNADQSEVNRILDEDLFPTIQKISKAWISARFKSIDANWDCWIQRPFETLAST